MSNAAPERGARLTLEEWAGLAEDVPGELVDGLVVEDEMAGWPHEVVVAWLLSTLHAWARAAGAWVIGSDARMAISPSRGRKADLVVHLADARRPPRSGAMRTPPSIVVEVISPSPSDARRDRVEKLADYATFGVRFYWIVDPQLRTLEILERGVDGRYAHALGASAGRLGAIPGCEGLAIDLDALWAELDRALAESED